MRRVFAPVRMAALFVYHVADLWPQHMVIWLRRLGGKLGRASDLDGPYLLLAGISAVFVTASTVAFAAQHPFSRAETLVGNNQFGITRQSMCISVPALLPRRLQSAAWLTSRWALDMNRS
jgi:hypothetical protein